MGVHDNLSDLKTLRESLKNALSQDVVIYARTKGELKTIEAMHTRAKKLRNQAERNLKLTKTQLASVERRIKALPGDIRRFTKAHPFKALEGK